jgi:prepilin-type N-terminal cleavage/methylation domain-containing protein
MTARPLEPEHAAAHEVNHGFTLVELVVAVAVMAVIMVGMGSAMLIAGRALPQAQSATSSTITAAEAAEQMTAELQYATAINQRSATMIEFTVSDRNGDEVPETIRYEWSGTAGAPLTRRYNAGATAEALSNVREFSLSYRLETISTEIPQRNESTETILQQYQSVQSLGGYPIKDLEWYGQYFRPALPANAVSWKVTRVAISARTDGTSVGEARVQLQLPTSGKCPSGVVLEEKTLLESSLLDSFQAREFAFSNASGLSPQQGLCLVVRWIADSIACQVWGQTRSVTETDFILLKSTNRGATWSSLSGQSLLYTIYGTVTATGTPQIQNTYYLKAIDIRLRTGDDSQSAVQTGVRILNRPEVSQ